MVAPGGSLTARCTIPSRKTINLLNNFLKSAKSMIQSTFVRTITILALAFFSVCVRGHGQAGAPGQPAAPPPSEASSGGTLSGLATSPGPSMTPAPQQFQQSVPQGTASST